MTDAQRDKIAHYLDCYAHELDNEADHNAYPGLRHREKKIRAEAADVRKHAEVAREPGVSCKVAGLLPAALAYLIEMEFTYRNIAKLMESGPRADAHEADWLKCKEFVAKFSKAMENR